MKVSTDSLQPLGVKIQGLKGLRYYATLALINRPYIYIYGLFFQTGHYIVGFHVTILITNCFFY